MDSHAGVAAFGGAALTHGFQIAFYVLAATAAAGAVVAALLIESRPGHAEPASEVAGARPCASFHSPVLETESTA